MRQIDVDGFRLQLSVYGLRQTNSLLRFGLFRVPTMSRRVGIGVFEKAFCQMLCSINL